MRFRRRRPRARATRGTLHARHAPARHALTLARARGASQLFYALEQKEEQLAEAMKTQQSLEQEVLTARQLTARGGGGDPKFIEIHHHNDISDDDEEEDKKEETESVAVS